ncbi:hypothetical protein AVEN_139064-1 [Araneus ventricosus]|uniref:Uncharacterized protein n=1 Tax=Araneus ventricosus TaxID=182803 RepID=A0A4Y2LMR7_ARAVE|nr:hypothetical protein AVEN_139064-1 [Araneus ventricosus]
MTTRSTAFSPISEKQPAEIRPTSIEVAWPVTAGLEVRVLNEQNSNCTRNERSSSLFDEFMVSHANTISGSKRYLRGYAAAGIAGSTSIGSAIAGGLVNFMQKNALTAAIN